MEAVIKLSSPDTREFWAIPIRYEDDHLLALDKPAGLLLFPARAEPARPSLMPLLRRDLERGAPWVRPRQLIYLANAHRLDFETTGVLLLAKDKPTLAALANQFGSQQPLRSYLALVQGAPEADTFTVEAKLAPHPVKSGLMRVDAHQGKPALTRFQVLERFAGYACLQAQPLTDRPHQIRVHLQYLRLPVVGDLCYGGKPLRLSHLKPTYRLKPGHHERPLLNRVALHAERLGLVHPVTGAALEIVAPWPKDLAVAIKYLRLFALNPPVPTTDMERACDVRLKGVQQ